jgi:hypothetical protein
MKKNKEVMSKSSEVPSRRKNPSLERGTFMKCKELKNNITEELHHL